VVFCFKILARTFVALKASAGKNGVKISKLDFFKHTEPFSRKVSGTGEAFAFGFDRAVNGVFIRGTSSGSKENVWKMGEPFSSETQASNAC